MAALALAAIPALLSAISSGIDIYQKGKELHRTGGRLYLPHYRRIVRRRRKHGGRMLLSPHIRRRRGKGIAADIVSGIPLLGMFAGPIVRALGGKIIHRRGYNKIVHTSIGPIVKHIKPTIVHKGKGLAPMYMTRPYTSHVGHGISMYGGALTHRKGFNKVVHTIMGPMVKHIRPTIVHKAGMLFPPGGHRYYQGKGRVRRPRKGYGLLSPAGGYMPYTF